MVCVITFTCHLLHSTYILHTNQHIVVYQRLCSLTLKFTFQSRSGSLTKMSMVQRSRSGQFLSALRTCVIQLRSCPLSEWGSNRLMICGVSLNGINSGYGRNCVGETGITYTCIYVHMMTVQISYTVQGMADCVHVLAIYEGALNTNADANLMEARKLQCKTCVAVPKAWPKSMPTAPPLSRSTMKFDRCRSPMPST